MSDIHRGDAIDRTIAEGGSVDLHHVHRRISWGALFGGVIIVVAIQLLLSLLGAGIGLGTVNVAAGSTPDASSFGFGAGLWWVVSSCLALFAGGFVSAWLAGIEIRFDGILHGLVTWGISTLLTAYLLTSAIGGIVGGGVSVIGGAASAIGGSAKDAAAPIAKAAGISPEMVQQQARAYLNPIPSDPAAMSPQGAQKGVAQNLVTYAEGGPDAAAAKARIIDVAAAQMKIGKADATKRFDEAQARFDLSKAQAIQKAKEAADASASGASKTAFAVFSYLVLGAIAALLGGALAVQRRVVPMATGLAGRRR